MALYGLWIGLAVALLYGAGVTGWIVLRTDWPHEIVRVRERLAGDQLEMERDEEARGERGVAKLIDDRDV